MDEREWLGCTHLERMLEFLTRRRGRHRRSHVSKRKLTIFACACCRRIWHLIPTQACRRAVEVSEQHADGRATESERAAACSAAFLSAEEEGIQLDDSDLLWWGKVPGAFAFQAAVGTASEVLSAQGVASDAATEVIWDARRTLPGREAGEVAGDQASIAEQHAQSLLLRDSVGNPFRPVALEPAWQIPAVLSLAVAAYHNRHLPAGILDTDRLAILADALEEAGCDNADILTHLRRPGPHIRGCWPLDLILSKVH